MSSQHLQVFRRTATTGNGMAENRVWNVKTTSNEYGHAFACNLYFIVRQIILNSRTTIQTSLTPRSAYWRRPIEKKPHEFWTITRQRTDANPTPYGEKSDYRCGQGRKIIIEKSEGGKNQLPNVVIDGRITLNTFVTNEVFGLD